MILTEVKRSNRYMDSSHFFDYFSSFVMDGFLKYYNDLHIYCWHCGAALWNASAQWATFGKQNWLCLFTVDIYKYLFLHFYSQSLNACMSFFL